MPVLSTRRLKCCRAAVSTVGLRCQLSRLILAVSILPSLAETESQSVYSQALQRLKVSLHPHVAVSDCYSGTNCSHGEADQNEAIVRSRKKMRILAGSKSSGRDRGTHATVPPPVHVSIAQVQVSSYALHNNEQTDTVDDTDQPFCDPGWGGNLEGTSGGLGHGRMHGQSCHDGQCIVNFREVSLTDRYLKIPARFPLSLEQESLRRKPGVIGRELEVCCTSVIP